MWKVVSTMFIPCWDLNFLHMWCWFLLTMPIESKLGVKFEDFLAFLIVDYPLWDQHSQIAIWNNFPFVILTMIMWGFLGITHKVKLELQLIIVLYYGHMQGELKSSLNFMTSFRLLQLFKNHWCLSLRGH